MLDDLFDMVSALFLALRNSNIVECIGRWDEDVVINDDRSICPAGGEAVT
jgi:hypothetical protein